jgi:hypothetical protein
MKNIIWVGVLALSAVIAANAQEESHLAVQAGGGFTHGIGRTGMYTDAGWNITAGIGYNFNSHVGALMNVSQVSLGVNSTTLNSIGAEGGNVNIFSATVDPIFHLMSHGNKDVYLTAGGGLFRRSQSFGPPLPAGVYFSNPFLFTNSSGSSVVNQFSVNKPGWDAGIGVAFGTKWHGKVYAEAKYEHMYLNGVQHTDLLPVTFGFRW